MMLLAEISALFTLFLCCVSLVESQVGVQKDLALQDIESKIANLDFFLVVFCKDDNEEECDDLVEEINDLFRESSQSFPGLEAALVNDPILMKKYGVEFFPVLVLFKKSDPYFYTDTQVDSASIYLWLEQHRHSNVLTLNDKNFEHDTQATTGSTTGDWFIMFYENHCCHLLSVWESVAGCLSHGQMYIYKGDPTKLETLASFARSDYKNVDALVIPPEPASGFSVLDQIQMDSVVAKIVLIGAVSLLGLIVIIIIISKRRQQRRKFD
ncbi:hypothetical protein LSH36_251g00060 [Paralvinella palmiformis]|uniref:Thioredoxin domain-containing protein n=1 Tax=Paralvinella palmiformis TaxID=53620 RepID=A0AAD9JLQ2_9ANNE|nr:hypothetical protein LSH36_251g00060 [Paralvinella palmiformis]